MSAVAIASLRMSNPDAEIIAVIDDCEMDRSSPAMREIDRFADRIVVQRVDLPNSVLRSRAIKTGLRKTIQGDFIYLDSDIVVLGNLGELWDVEGDIAAAPDIDSSGRISGFPPAFETEFATLGWSRPAKPYLNTGVFLMRDRPAVHALGERLAADWRRFHGVRGRANDQPVFNHVFRSSDAHLAVLPLRYNAQILSNPWTARGARIAHVFSGGFAERSDTVFHLATRRLKVDGHVDLELLAEAQDRGHVWTSLDTTKKAFATGAYGLGMVLGIKRLLGRR